MDLVAYLRKTEELMMELHVPVRDTYKHDVNLDDFYTNGKLWNGPRRLKIEWVDTAGYPEMDGKIYQTPQYRSAAYDVYTLLMPVRYKNSERDDPIIHELVHFLQHNTPEEDKRYIKFTGRNYSEYLTQRVELEAHAVQTLYILRHTPAHRDKHLTPKEQEQVTRALLDAGRSGDLRSAIPALRLCLEKDLI